MNVATNVQEQQQLNSSHARARKVITALGVSCIW